MIGAASPALARVARGDLCAGCGACAGLSGGKIAMAAAPPGFLRPVQREALTPSEEAAIALVCPGLGQVVDPAGRPDHPLWGPFLEMHVGWATDPALRFAGASGGALSAVLMHLLDSGTIEAVVQVRAAATPATANETVVCTDRVGILAAAGSRYAPSAPLADLAALVADNRRFAFVGKPCDAAALRALAGSDPAVARAFPVILSFFCAGVPSLAGSDGVLAALGTGVSDVVRFRYRGQGWPGRATATLAGGGERSMSYYESWGKILSRHVQFRCKICADGAGAAADVVCADAWESDERGYPRFEEGEGVSLVVARTALGGQLLAAAEAAGTIVTRPFDPETLAAIQTGQVERRRGLLSRLAALRVAGRPVPRYQGLQLVAAARQNSLRRNVRNFAGMLRRALMPRRGQPR